MKFDKEKWTLLLLKASAYVINAVIITSVLLGVGFFVYYLFLGSTAKIKKKPLVGYSVEQRVVPGLVAKVRAV